MGRLFGTDGIRGVAGEELTADCAYRLGLSLAGKLRESKGCKPSVVIGKDTRLSGDMFEAAITAGLCAGGSDVMLIGVVPTPAVAFLCVRLGTDAGVMISASHNPSEYNGLKVFGGEGYKLSDDTEEQLEAMILGELPITQPGREIGRVIAATSELSCYIEHIKSVFDEIAPGAVPVRRVLFDLSNGSASATAKAVFTSSAMYGYKADFIAYDPNGININDNCGSTQMNKLSRMVVDGAYDIGIAFDGDADRCLVSDENGNIVNGDMIIARLAIEMKKQNRLHGDTAVVTKLSNLGFHNAARKYGFKVAVTDVGDRYVLEEMLRGGYSIGGEQSGHIILSDYATTGDGQITAAKIIGLLASYPAEKTSEIFSTMKMMPQVTINVHVPASATKDDKNRIIASQAVSAAVGEAREALGDNGRILLRSSGTEPVIRIMLEGEDEDRLLVFAKNAEKAIKESI